MAAVFRKALRDSRRMALWLSVGLGVYAILIISFYPSMLEQSEEFDKLIEAYPEGILEMFTGGQDAASIELSNPGTWVQLEFASYVVLILGAIMIVQAFNAFTNAERDGSMDIMLSLPVSRRDYLLGRAAHTAILALIVLTACFLGFSAASLIWSEFDVGVDDLALGMYGAFFPLMAVACFAYLLASVAPSSKRFAGAIAYLVLIGSYLLYGISAAVEGLKGIQPLLLFHYYNAGDLINNGVRITDWLILTAAALVCLGLAWWFVDRKELGV